MTLDMNLMVMYCEDIEAARQFYGRVGIPFELEKHGNGPEHFAAKLGQTVLELYPRRNGKSPSTVRIGFVVDDLTSVIETMRGAGDTIATEPADSPWGRRAVVKDPNGNAVELIQKTDLEP